MTQLILMVGHVGAGKTTRATRLARDTGAVRLTPDEWMGPLFRHHDPEGMRDVLEGRLVWTALEMLRAGTDVILDFGFWGRDERAALAWAAGRLGARVRTEHVDVDRETQSRQVARRWEETPEQTWEVTQADLDRWRTMLQEPDAAELSGIYSEPQPAEGWAAWISRRWPSSAARTSAGDVFPGPGVVSAEDPPGA
ncbi:AAA family ATPase [Brachybacterium hainanense]|uniref:AAA family ATPase n=1 Tax=Brachybacterium hainanense TaxID=1541174 RepID=A0ABV6RF57_9MICO